MGLNTDNAFDANLWIVHWQLSAGLTSIDKINWQLLFAWNSMLEVEQYKHIN